MTTTITNKQFAASDPKFIEACKLANIPPTPRQASKWRRKQGLAYTLKYKTTERKV